MFTYKETIFSSGKCLRLYEIINGDLNNNNSLNEHAKYQSNRNKIFKIKLSLNDR